MIIESATATEAVGIENAAATAVSHSTPEPLARDDLSAAQLIDHLMSADPATGRSAFTLAQIATRSGISQRTLEDIRYGRSRGLRARDALLHLLEGHETATASRAAVRAELHTQQAQEAAIAEGLIAQMEAAAQRAEQTERLFVAACRFLGLSCRMMRLYERLGPIGVQTVIDRAYREQAAQIALLGRAYVQASQAQNSTADVVAGTLANIVHALIGKRPEQQPAAYLPPPAPSAVQQSAPPMRPLGEPPLAPGEQPPAWAPFYSSPRPYSRTR